MSRKGHIYSTKKEMPIPYQVMKWTTMSLRKIVNILNEKFNINVCHFIVQDILQEEGDSRQKNK